MPTHKKILDAVNTYYTDKVKQFGDSPQGVDWNSEESQVLRFEQLCKLLPQNKEEQFSVLDYGCGYGAMSEYVSKNYPNAKYIGYDISEEMIKKAKEKYPSQSTQKTNQKIEWITEIKENATFDYVIASGIFSVKLKENPQEWHQYILDTLSIFNTITLKGFSFNCLTSFSDKEYMKEHLYYANPMELFSYCKTNFSRYVALLHDYPIYEFCLLIKKNNFYE
ncbi:MAG: SAM-dependent methyltransferase [Flexibacter sp. CG_4_10_14_3_um_filter_32_15]|nr:MAG: SAM-dependent methyltransferase [Flexibacter sp. CG_4_10_14_3_um_filter_32_15]